MKLKTNKKVALLFTVFICALLSVCSVFSFSGNKKVNAEESTHYTLTFYDGVSLVETVQTITRSGVETYYSSLLSKADYVFIGWATSPDGDVVYYVSNEDYVIFSNVTSDLTLYAKYVSVYSITHHTIHFFVGGEETGTVTTNNYNYCSFDNPYKPNRMFLGWALTEGGEVEFPTGEFNSITFYNVNENMNLYAVFESNHYDVTFYVDEEIYDTVESITRDDVEVADIENPTKTGYTFSGWALSEDGEVVYENGTEATIISDIEEDLSLYAVFSKISTGSGGSSSSNSSSSSIILKLALGVAIFIVIIFCVKVVIVKISDRKGE